MKETFLDIFKYFIVSFIVISLIGGIAAGCIAAYGSQNNPSPSVTEVDVAAGVDVVTETESDISGDNMDSSASEITENNTQETVENRPLTVSEEINRQRTKADEEFIQAMEVFAIMIAVLVGIILMVCGII